MQLTIGVFNWPVLPSLIALLFKPFLMTCFWARFVSTIESSKVKLDAT